MNIYKVYQSGLLIAEINFSNWTLREIDHGLGTYTEWKDFDDEVADKYWRIYRVPRSRIFSLLDNLDLFETSQNRLVTKDSYKFKRAEIVGQDLLDHSQTWVEEDIKFPLDLIFIDGELVSITIPQRERATVITNLDPSEHPLLKKFDRLSPVDHTVVALPCFNVPMRDGVRLATSVYLPSGLGPWPCILIRTPYKRDAGREQYWSYVRRGYGVVIQDVRGREDSEGEWEPNIHEQNDGEDTLKWLHGRDWCDGKIGMLGGSYLGYVQWAAAASGSPYLSAICSIVTAGSAFLDIPRKGGTYVSGTLAWNVSLSTREFMPEKMIRDDWDEVLAYRPIAEVMKQKLGSDPKFWAEQFEHENEDDYWLKTAWIKKADKIRVPALIASGWFDDNGMGTSEAIDVVNCYPQNLDYKIILGPWCHSGNAHRSPAGYQLEPHSLRYDMDIQFIAWFDYLLKGQEYIFKNEARVNWYSMGDNQWREATKWPPAQVQATPFFLNFNGIGENNKAGRLERLEPQEESKYTYLDDPLNPVTHLIDLSENEMGMPGDYVDIIKQNNLVYLQTDKLEKKLTVAGDFYLDLWLSCDQPDTDIIAKILDLTPDGKAYKLADFILAAKFRDGFDKISLLEANQPVKVRIRSTKLGHTFAEGHRIALMIASSAKNFIYPNYHTGQPRGHETEARLAKQTVYSGPNMMSCLWMPILGE